MKKSPLISTILVKGDHNIHNYDSLFIPVVVYSLYVIILVKEIKDSLHLLDRFLIGKLNPVLRNHSNISLYHRDSGFLKSLADCTVITS